MVMVVALGEEPLMICSRDRLSSEKLQRIRARDDIKKVRDKIDLLSRKFVHLI